jgi:antitoxin YefM
VRVGKRETEQSNGYIRKNVQKNVTILDFFSYFTWANITDMRTATITEFRSKMKEQLQQIEDDKDILILSGPKKKDFVVLTLEQFNSMEETAHLLSTPNNAARILESIAQDKAGQVTVRDFSSGEPRNPRKKTAAVKRKK